MCVESAKVLVLLNLLTLAGRSLSTMASVLIAAVSGMLQSIVAVPAAWAARSSCGPPSTASARAIATAKAARCQIADCSEHGSRSNSKSPCSRSNQKGSGLPEAVATCTRRPHRRTTNCAPVRGDSVSDNVRCVQRSCGPPRRAAGCADFPCRVKNASRSLNSSGESRLS